MKKNTLQNSSAAKVIGVILLCTLCMGVTLCRSVVRTCSSFDVSSEAPADASGYYATEDCIARMKNEALRVVSSEESAASAKSSSDRTQIYNQLKAAFSKDQSNSRFELEKQSSSGVYVHVIGNTSSDDSYGIQKTWIAESSDGEGYDLVTDDGKENGTYRVTIAVMEPIEVEDIYYDSHQQYESFASRYISVSALKYGIIAMLAAAVVIFVLECRGAGHKKGTDGIDLTWFDRMPYEGMTAMIIALEILWVSYVDVPYDFMREILLVTGSALLFYFWLMSTIVRCKAHTLWKSTWLSRLVSWMKETPAVWNIAAIVFCIIYLLVTLTLASDSGMIAKVIVLVLDLILILLVITIVHSMTIILTASSKLSSGNLDYRISDADLSHLYGPFRTHAQNLNAIGEGMQIAIHDKVKSEQLKAELITNVSHDIRTPLTSIISYTDLLTKDHTEEQEKEYLGGLSRQSARLNRLCTDLIDASKASTGNIPVHTEKVKIKELMEQSLAEYEGRFQSRNLNIVIDISPDDLAAQADGRLLWRVLSNLFSNVSKYALENTRVYINGWENSDQKLTISIKNTSREPLNIPADELMERFIRGDRSRHTEGSGLGLDIAKSLTELMHGTFSIFISGDLFEADVILPLYKEQ